MREVVLGGSGKFAVLLTERVKTPRNNWVISRGYRGLVPERDKGSGTPFREPMSKAGRGPFRIFIKEGLGASQVGQDRGAERLNWYDTHCTSEKI